MHPLLSTASIALIRNVKNIFSFLTVFLCFQSISAYTQTTVGVGSGQAYPTLNDAIAAVNNGTITGTVRLEIRSNISVSSTVTLNASGTGGAAYSTLSIYPTGTYAITANVNGPVIELASAQRVTIDGRINGNASGTVYSLTLENTNTGSNASLVHIRDGGSQALVQYMLLKGGGGSATRGLFSVDGTGNAVNNILQYSRITNTGGNRPYSIFYVNATGASSSAIFFGNEVFDIFRADVGTKAVVLTGTLSASYVMNNHFYETAPVNATAANTYRAVSVEGAASAGALVQGNYIGGSQINAAGSAMTFTSASAPQFDAIYISGGTSVAPASVQNNTITNISFQSSKNNLNNIYSPGFFNAIYISGSNVYANVGSVTGNTIGSQSATGAIQLFPTNTTQYCPGIMIFNDATGTVNIQNNTLGGITSTGAALAKSIVCILDVATAGTRLISGNTIGSPTTANSISVGSNSLNTSVNELLWGIACLNASGTITITGNTVVNLTQQVPGPNSSSLKQLAGIFLSNGGNAALNDNRIHHLTSYSNMMIGGEFSSLVGINVFQNTGSISSVSGNTTYELQNPNTANLTNEVTGIFFKGNTGTTELRNNFVHSLQLSSSNTAAKINGVNIGASAGIAQLSNNVISLGTGISSGYTINGIFDGSQSASNSHKYYYNTIYLAGTPGTGNNTAAVYFSSDVASGRELLNNILVNERSNVSGTAKHYGLYVTGTPLLTANYNDYYTPNTGGVAGFYSTDKTVLPVVTGQDAASLIKDPSFTLAGGTDAANYIPNSPLAGSLITGYEDDFLGITRLSNPYMGAFYYTSALPVTWLDFTLHPGNAQIVLRWSTASEQFSQDFVIQHSENAVNWNNLGTVPAAGNSNVISRYQFIHLSPSNGKNYYRILQLDRDGRFSYSEIRNAAINNSLKGLQVLGNPIAGGLLAFRVNQPIELSLISPEGRFIWKKKFSAGKHQVNIQNLKPGTYYLYSATETVVFVK